jgi:hypothetical protein
VVKVVIRGRGQALKRAPVSFRMDAHVLEEVEEVVAGPRYLALEYLVKRGLDAVRREPGQIVIDAGTLKPIPAQQRKS